MAEHFISTPAVLDTCRHCGAPLLIAHCEGILARADAQPIDTQGELAALMAGLRTYDIQPAGLPRRPYLADRHQFRIRAPRRWPVVADHRCPPGPHFPPPKRPPVELIIPIGMPIPDEPPF